ncbi:Guanine nucleotide-binding protein alpha-2 subunit [Orbilia oligospora]|uniref:Guanine nucleotide-binding protein alpha-2 subunit n=2 Tax=Orbilia oligospora TaxID=2813651 RepID=A0A6G1M2L3_ORBOL|nr:Guanine nucleotide-binding protein alpha-2 subunit [Orbilia oligospora]KAF3243256.1 Guanine nucleotide-binding protein alpha-2 subunit [Orbilia oligospora]
MGGCMSREASEEMEQRKKSQAIDREIMDDSRRLRRECKILLLGSGESGKSTIVKQMKIIHQNGYTVDELQHYRLTVYKNLVDCAKALIDAMRQFDIVPEHEANKEHMEFLYTFQVDPDPNVPLDLRVSKAVAALWDDPAVPSVLEHQSEFYIMDSAPYFFAEAARIGSPEYIPSEADVLRARTKTTGIYETRFTMGQLNIHMFDVGGQRSERKKWIHCFESVTSIIFCVALSEYDQVLLEEQNQVRKTET